MILAHTTTIAILLVLLNLFGSGCGPMQMPMVVRLKEPEQAQIDEAWSKALQPVDRLSAQALLDTLLITQGYQIGVDTLAFRSEKRCAAGLVVMEIHFDRLQPDDDLFTVSVLSEDGRVLRREDYLRDDVEGTYHALFIEETRLAKQVDDGFNLPREQKQRLEELEARHALAMSLFPRLNVQPAE